MRRPKRTFDYRLEQVMLTILCSPLILLLFFGSYALMTMGTEMVDDLYQMTGVVSSIHDSTSLQINLNNSDRTFTIYRLTHNYADLVEKLKTGDSVTIYTAGQGYTELIQLEKEGTLIYAANEFKTKYILSSIFSFAAALFSTYVLIKYWRK